MKIVDKYGLAECNPGTPFFVLNSKYLKNGKEYYTNGGYLDSPMRVKIGDTFYAQDGTSMFNGVLEIEIENDEYKEFTEDTLPKKIELVTNDTDSNDFTDNDRFLILNSKEFRDVLDELEKCYLQLKHYEEIEQWV